MNKKRIMIAGACTAVLGILGFAYYYMTEPNLRFINTRTSELDLGPQYVKIETDQYENMVISENTQSGSQIETDIERVDSGVTTTIQIDEMLKNELATGEYSFQEPMVIQNPYQNSPLTAVALFKDNQSSAIRVTVKGKTPETDIVDTVKASDENIIPIIGLYPDMENEVILERLDESGEPVETKSLRIQTEPLPDSLRDIVKTEQKNTEAAFQLIMVTGGKTPFLYGFDANGDIRWYSTEEDQYYGLYPLENGRFLVEASNVMSPTASSPHSAKFNELDMLGRVYKTYYIPYGVHHDIKEMESGGNFLMVSNGGAGYEQDAIMEIDRETGEIVKRLDLKEILGDTGYVDSDDWAHINTVSYDSETDTILISARNLHSGISINWSTDEVEWILGNPEFWEDTSFRDKVLAPEGEIEWHYQPHTIYRIADIDNNPDTINIMLYDNHIQDNRKVPFFDGIKKSFVKQYTIDPAAMTVKQEKKFESIRSKITSNFILEYEKERIFAVSASISEEKDYKWGRVYEYDYNTGEVLNQYSVEHQFYRGYSVTVDLESCQGSIDKDSPYGVGELRIPVKTDKKPGTPLRKLKKDSKASFGLALEGNLLFAEAKDHSYTQLIFKGKENTYVYDISDFKKKKNASYVYRIAIPLNKMAADEYTVYGMFSDDYFRTGYTFTIME